MNNKTELEVIKRFLDGRSIDRIVHGLDLTKEEAIEILAKNPSTKERLSKYIKDKEEGKYVPFFIEAKKGREKLPDNKKRKKRQVRISDDEMEQLGNPSTTEIRQRLFTLKKIEKLCEMLDEEGYLLIPNEKLERHYDKNDSFWYEAIYKKNYNRLKGLAESVIKKLDRQT